jgi:hypothetical protein
MSQPTQDEALPLVKASDALGELVRSYGAELSAAADEPRAWQRLSARLEAEPTGRWRFPLVFALGTAAFALTAVLLVSWRSADRIAVTAEVIGMTAKQSRSAAAPPLPPPLPSVSAAVKEAPAKPAPSFEPATCDALVKAQAFDRAAHCYERRAQGTGLDAELALYELARLRLNALGDAAGAARACELYRARFPAGSFRSQIDKLWQRADLAAAKPPEVEKSGSDPEGRVAPRL